jgi:hypothetical protein
VCVPLRQNPNQKQKSQKNKFLTGVCHAASDC